MLLSVKLNDGSTKTNGTRQADFAIDLEMHKLKIF